MDQYYVRSFIESVDQIVMPCENGLPEHVTLEDARILIDNACKVVKFVLLQYPELA